MRSAWQVYAVKSASIIKFFSHLGSELFVHETGSALVALEAGLVPVLLLVAQILGVDTDDLATLVAVVGEDTLVTLDTVGTITSQHISEHTISE